MFVKFGGFQTFAIWSDVNLYIRGTKLSRSKTKTIFYEIF